ncbi:PilZ domain-containing protein [Psychromonas sp. SP041]|uniref:PilZ domain-containing protein n=1 Tax=Psychromonas sp. SP041 TaxID=1365007 RepID=UPI0004254ADA|nr:PilZ domain-containing protein [Psychromonas sp. SP041]
MNNNEYFLVEHALSINLKSIDKCDLPLNQFAFEDEIPGPFRMASDLAKADASILAPLKLNSDNTQALWNYLQAQNQKINTLLSYVLTQQDDEKSRHQTIKFSAGSIIIKNNNTLKIDDNIRLKIFLPEESSAIYCYATVSNINDSEYAFTYTFIREQDRELLIRASLHVQSQQLKNRAKQRELNT